MTQKKTLKEKKKFLQAKKWRLTLPERKNVLHKSFKRSYREDYVRKLELPGLLAHAVASLKMMWKNKKLFGRLILIIVLLNVFLVGLMSEQTYVKFQEALEEGNQVLAGGKVGNFAKASLLLISTITTGGLNQAPSESQQIFAIFLFLVSWLVTIFLVRHILAEKKINLRDAFYNALSPLLSTICVIAMLFLQALPILIVIIAYSAAVVTKFLETPFYALVFFIFAMLMIILALYWMSGTFLALVAVTTPGLYPLVAMSAVNDLIAGRRMKIIGRLVFLLFFLAVIWAVVVVPLIMLDLWIKTQWVKMVGVPFISIILAGMSSFSFVYAAVYFYLLYRKILAYDEN